MINTNDKWSQLSMSQKADLIRIYVNSGITNLDTIKNEYNRFEDGGPKKERYPEVTIKEEPWAEEYFKNNPNVAGMAIGEGMNSINGPRRVIYNPYNEAMKDSTQRAGLLTNERLRHYMDETNYTPKNITKEQISKYADTPYQNDTLNIGRTEIARYLTGDKNLLTPEQKVSADSLFTKYKKFNQ